MQPEEIDLAIKEIEEAFERLSKSFRSLSAHIRYMQQKLPDPPLGFAISVTKDNVQKIQQVSDAMHRRISELQGKLKDYPMEINFEETIVFFETAEDLTNFLSELDSRIALVKKA